MSTDAKPTEPTAAPAPEADVEMEGGEDDFTKIAAARKQGLLSLSAITARLREMLIVCVCLCYPVEFYFGDSNLPFDKLVQLSLLLAFIHVNRP